MEAVAHQLNFRWLTEADPEPLCILAEHEELTLRPIPMPKGLGHGWVEIMDLAFSMNICRVVHHFTPGLQGLQPMSEVVADLTEPLFFVQTLSCGKGVLLDRRLDVRLAHEPGVCTFQFMDRINHQHWADVSADIEVTALGLGWSSLCNLIGEDTSAALLGKLGLNALPSASVHAVPPAVRAIAQTCFEVNLTGQVRKLHAQAKLLEFIVGLVGHFVSDEQKPLSQTEAIHALRGELDGLEGEVPCLMDLAKRYGLSERAMSDGFKREFGVTLCAYIVARRLQAAHAALIASNVPFKVLSAKLGYSHVNNFSRAFKAKFGLSPANIRRANATH